MSFFKGLNASAGFLLLGIEIAKTVCAFVNVIHTYIFHVNTNVKKPNVVF